jgi:hypothetical protein
VAGVAPTPLPGAVFHSQGGLTSKPPLPRVAPIDIAIVHRTPSKRARAARFSSRANTTDRFTGAMPRPIPRSRPDPSIDICRWKNTMRFGASFFAGDGA